MISYTQFYNENEGRKFPFEETATLQSNNISLPTDLIVDLSISIPSTLTGVYCPIINITQYAISISLASSTLGLLVGSFARSSLVPYKAYALSPVIDDVSGWIVFGNGIANAVTGCFQFANSVSSAIAQRCINYIDVLPVKKFIKLGGSLDTYVTDIVKLKAQGDLIIKKHETDTNTIVLELGTPSDFVGPCNKLTDIGRDGIVSLHSINNVKPDANGTIILEFVT